MRLRALTLCFLSLFILSAAGGGATAFENPPNSNAQAVLGDLANGSNYSVENPVRSDGFLRLFAVKSKYGRFTINGQQRLMARLRELAALHVLEQKSKSKAFTSALGQSRHQPAEACR